MFDNKKADDGVHEIEKTLSQYKENIQIMQQSLEKMELVVAHLQSEGLLEAKKLAHELNMLQRLSTSIEFKAKCLICNNGETIETSTPV
ncbi:hypothetical protein ACMGD3_09900 [Lysinibacillus sphaericus]|uniref:hypothetical protein n=1 Tax=Lysinibacillus sphaericus TaxID=1421 RepID=UPI003F7997C6